MRSFKRYIYKLRKDDLYDLLLDFSRGVEVLSESDDRITFATYEDIKGLKPLKAEKVNVKPMQMNFRPFQVGSLLIVPPWTKTLTINPAMAFGTGLHASTQVSLLLIEEFFKEGWDVIDVGCGSGILSIALKKLSAKRVLAIDKDEVAIKECKKNAQLNSVDVNCVLAKPEEIKETFDFLVANLEIGIFKEVITHIKPLFREYAVLSGLYKKKELNELLKLIPEFKVAKIKKLKDWYGIVIKA
ncbi:MAG: 50S ribosomal protein L11 methyltransferase [Aquificaceae bacterium]